MKRPGTCAGIGVVTSSAVKDPMLEPNLVLETPQAVSVSPRLEVRYLREGVDLCYLNYLTS